MTGQSDRVSRRTRGKFSRQRSKQDKSNIFQQNQLKRRKKSGIKNRKQSDPYIASRILFVNELKAQRDLELRNCPKVQRSWPSQSDFAAFAKLLLKSSQISFNFNGKNQRFKNIFCVWIRSKSPTIGPEALAFKNQEASFHDLGQNNLRNEFGNDQSSLLRESLTPITACFQRVQ